MGWIEGNMPKKKSIAAGDLIEVFRGELQTSCHGVRRPNVAIVPDPKNGWAALISQRDRKAYPKVADQVAEIEKMLRLRYSLKDD
jgi:hypothetical protein